VLREPSQEQAAVPAVRDLEALAVLGSRQGLAAGLGAVLASLDVPSAAPAGFAAVPAGLARAGAGWAGAVVVPHGIAEAEHVTVLRLPSASGSPSWAGSGPGLVGERSAALAAVRLGVLTAMLGQAVRHLAGRTAAGTPLIDKQLVSGAVANLVAEAEEVRAELESSVREPGRESAPLADAHDRLSGLGWQLTALFGASGYLRDHPVRSLYVSETVANIWIAGDGQ
jgi:hypothetical protein